MDLQELEEMAMLHQQQEAEQLRGNLTPAKNNDSTPALPQFGDEISVCPSTATPSVKQAETKPAS